MAEDKSKEELRRHGVENTALKKKLGEVCVYCGCNNKLILEIDHKKPLNRGGEDTDANKQVTCVICNRLKGSLGDTEFKKYLKSLYILKDLNKVRVKVEMPEVKFSSWGFPLTPKELDEKEKREEAKAL